MLRSTLLGLAAALVTSAVRANPPISIPGLAPPDLSKFQYYPVKTALSGPCDITTAPDGKSIWVQDILQNIIVRLDPETGDIEEHPVPYHDHAPANFTLADLLPNKLALACGIQPGEDGMLYAVAGIRGQFLRINPDTREIKVYQPPPPASVLSNLEPFNDIWRGPDGMYFTLTTANVLFHFDYKTEHFTPYTPPTPGSGPLGTYLASDGNIWICQYFANKIAKFNLKTREFTEYTSDSIRTFLPSVMRAESPTGTLWFTGLGGQSMGSINIHTGEFRVVPDNALPPGFPTVDTVSPDGRVWWSTLGRPTLQNLDPVTDNITYITQPTLNPAALTIGVTYSPLRNSIYFAETANNRIGRYQL